MQIIDHTTAPAVPLRPVPAATGSHGGPPMPWAVREVPGPGGHVARFKAHPNGALGDVLVPEDEAVLARVGYLEGRVTNLLLENATLRTQLAAVLPPARGAATVEALVEPLPDGIEAATVEEVTVALSDEEVGAWISRMVGPASLFAPNAAPGLDPGARSTDHEGAPDAA